MNAAEVLQLCRLVKACCPSQVLDEFTPQAWGLILGRYDYADAKAAVAAIVSAPMEPGKSRYIEPGHIIGGINRIRGKRLEATPLPAPPDGLDSAAYVEWSRRTRDQIASGTYVPSDAPKAIASPARVAELLRDAMPKLTTEETR